MIQIAIQIAIHIILLCVNGVLVLFAHEDIALLNSFYVFFINIWLHP